MSETPLQIEIRKMGTANLADQQEAEKGCKTWHEVDVCRDAYTRLYWDKVDVIQQRHGIPPILRKLP